MAIKDYPGRRGNYYWDPPSKEELVQELERRDNQIKTLQEMLFKADKLGE